MARDAQTLLAGYRAKYPKYANVDDATLYGAIVKAHPEYSDIKLNAIPKHETFLQGLLNSPGGNTAIATAVGGPILGAYQHASEDPTPPENLIPGATVAATSLIPGMQGFGADMMGAYGGTWAKNAVKELRGEQPNYGSSLPNALLTGLISGTTRGAGNLVYAKPEANEAMNQAKQNFGKVMDKLKSLSGGKAKIPFPWLKGAVNDALKSGEFSNTKTMNDLSTLSDKLNPYRQTGIPIENAHSFETELGSLGKFPNPLTGKMMNEKVPGNINQIVTNLRNNVSGMIDRRAASAGVPEFADASSQYAGAAQRLAQLNSRDNLLSRIFGNSFLGVPGMIGRGLQAISAPVAQATYGPVVKSGLSSVLRGQMENQAQRLFQD